jgi:ABC-type methionine transport system permease subunit
MALRGISLDRNGVIAVIVAFLLFLVQAPQMFGDKLIPHFTHHCRHFGERHKMLQ